MSLMKVIWEKFTCTNIFLYGYSVIYKIFLLTQTDHDHYFYVISTTLSMLADAPLLAAGKSARKLTRSGSQNRQVNTQPVQRKRRRRKNRNKNRGRKRKGIF